MIRERFPLTSDQMELLMAFESAGSLEKLADAMAKDASVVSRNLQKLAGIAPVIAKVAGRWHLTPLGKRVNVFSRQFLGGFSQLLAGPKPKKGEVPIPLVPERAILLVINGQKSLQDSWRGSPSNLSAEQNIGKLLAHWRRTGRLIVHVKHISQNPESPFFTRSPGCDFMETLQPQKGEVVIEKRRASAFAETNLLKFLRKKKPEALVLVGFTAAECIDATARQASDLGFLTFVVGDATATFDLRGPKNQLYKAVKLHKITLAKLHALFAEVVETEKLL